MRTWTELPDAFVPSDGPAFDDQAIWTGSILRSPDGLWHFFYTGCSRENPLVQRIGLATSPDLITWTRDPDWTVIQTDARYYPDRAGDGWHMLLTARARVGESDQRSVVGHATSPDLAT